ncbi:MAG: zinc-ribbon domain-containing protein [Deltaproteobacteria bacterium]|nr:zinc-ribbon domain-containing protein [Deltaproteobacteria bacterium]
MEIVCNHCSARLNIPDDKIPEGRRVRVTCPKCGNKLPIEPRNTARDVPDIHETGPGPWPGEDAGMGEHTGPTGLEFYGEDETLALVLDLDTRDQDVLKEVLSELGYRCLVEADAEQAVKRMNLYAFDLVFLADGFDGGPVEQSPIMAYINRLSMAVRRRMFLVLISPRFKTMDRMAAFSKSADLVVNKKDVPNVNRILGMAISDHEKFYKVFMDTLREIGKA